MFWRYWNAVLMVVYLNFWFVSRTSVDEIGQYKVSASTCIWYPFLLKKKFFSFEVDLQFCSSFVYFFYDMFIFCPNYVNPPIFPPFIFHYYFKVSACKILIFFCLHYNNLISLSFEFHAIHIHLDQGLRW